MNLGLAMALYSLGRPSEPVSPYTFAAFDPARTRAGYTLTESNQRVQTNAQGNTVTTMFKSSGAWYWEFEIISGGNTVGVDLGYADMSVTTDNWPGDAAASSGGWMGTNAYASGVNVATIGAYVDGDTVGVALNIGNEVTFYKNGTLTAVFPNAGGSWSPCVGAYDLTGGEVRGNFGNRPFKHTVPAGFNPGWYVPK